MHGAEVPLFHPSEKPAKSGGTQPGFSRRSLMWGAAGLAGLWVARGAGAQEPQRPSFGIGRQMEVYQRGMQGQRPAQAVSLEALEAEAQRVMTPEAYGYVAGGAGSEDTMRENLEAFRRRRIVPRMLRDVRERDLSVEVLGQKFPAPLLLAPVGVQSIIHKEAELGTARAAQRLGLPVVLSTVSSTRLEDVAAVGGPRWFQLYWPRDPELAASLVGRAERAGYTALVVTLDTFLLAWRERDLTNAYLPFFYGEGLANYLSDPAFRVALPAAPEKDPRAAIEHFGRVFSDPGLTWKDLAFLRKHTRLPILLKGILHADDAREAVQAGADGIIVSNHGGRQVDGAIAALDALPRVVDTVGSKTTVLFDSGIRRGADVLKAIALGARAVLVGRPYCYGLAVGGEQGVRTVMENLLADVDLTLGLAGCAGFREVNRGILD
jgi:lactate 2-monooxygenase